MAKPVQKTYASAEIPAVAAALDGLLRLETEAQVIAFLENIAAHHIVAREQLPATPKGSSLTLWIRDYDVTPEEEKDGALGNFAALGYKQINQRWTIYPTKLCLSPAKHPQRKYVARGQHPNWGHPLLKAMKKNKLYRTLEAAQHDLARLHEQFPTATIPTKQKLYVMVFSRIKGKASTTPVEKWVLEPKVTPEGLYYVDIYTNKGKPRGAKPAAKASPPKDDKPNKDAGRPHGYFTARETLKRKKKAKR